MPIKSVKMKISKKSQGSLNPKIWFLGQMVCPVAHSQIDRLTDTDRVTAERTLLRLQFSSLQPILFSSRRTRRIN